MAVKFVNDGGKLYGSVNCALCTIAKILQTNSSGVAKMLGFNKSQSETVFAANQLKKRRSEKKELRNLDPLELQNHSLQSMKELVKNFMNHFGASCYISQGGSMETLVPMRVQKGLMQSFPVGTQYAVYGCMEMSGLGAHWNYAVRTDKGLEFRDYQYNDSEANKAFVSDSFIAPKGCEWSSESYVQGIVLVFRRESKLVN